MAMRRNSRLPGLSVAIKLALAGCLACSLAGCGSGSPTGSSPELLRRQAENAEIEGRFDWARVYYGELRKQVHEDPELLRREGLAWLAGYQQSWSEGIRLLGLSLAKEEDRETRRRLVEKATALGDFAAAQQFADKLADSAYDLCLRAEAELGEPEKARGLAEQALAKASKEHVEPALVARIHLLLASLAEGRGEVGLALEYAKAATLEAPLDPAGFYLLGRLYRRAREAEPAKAALERCEALRRLSHDGTLKPLPPAEALTLLRDLEAQASPAFSFSRRKLELLFAAGEREEAQTLIEKLRQDPAFGPRERAEAATWAAASGSKQLARTLFEEVLAVKRNDIGAESSLAVLELERGAFSDARQRLEKAMVVAPGIARYEALMARLALSEDKAEEAEQHFRRALELAPWNWDWRQSLAELLIAQGRQNELPQLLANLPETPPAAEAFLARFAH